MSINTRINERDDVFQHLAAHVVRKAQLRPGEDLTFTPVRSNITFDDKVELYASYFCGGKLIGRYSQDIKVEPTRVGNWALFDRMLETLDYLANVVRPFPGPKQRIQRWRGKRR